MDQKRVEDVARAHCVTTVPRETSAEGRGSRMMHGR